MGKAQSVIAAQRFGLGPRPGDLTTIDADPRGWLSAQITPNPLRPAALATLPPATDRVEAIRADRQARKDNKHDAANLPNAGQQAPNSQNTTQKPDKLQAGGDGLRQLYIADAALRCEVAIASETPLVERLVQFWSNHFTVSGQRPVVAPLALPFETEAIRPHVFGTFGAMLLASTRHPAMQLYLDNAQSVGPLSRFGAQRAKGLNENFARELMELQTLGVDGGYSQADMREVAKILTGWTVAGLGGGNRQLPNAGGNPQRPNRRKALFGQSSDQIAAAATVSEEAGFRFAPMAHEPGDKTVLGRTYHEDGEAEGAHLLVDLAAHPATAKHVATKLARHFISDTPPDAVVASLTKTYLDSGGDLAAMTRALIATDAAWQEPAQKIRTPNDWVIASFRALQLGGNDLGKRALSALRQLGQLPFMAPSPAGWADQSADWLSPDALMTQIDLARVVVRRVPETIDPRRLVSDIIGPDVSPETAFQINNAPSKPDALALLLVSPEFLRR